MAEQRNHEQRYHHSLKSAHQPHPAQIKPLHAKEDSPVFVNKLGERITPNQFSKETMVPSPDQSEDTPMGLLLIRDTVISVDTTAHGNITRWRKELTSQ